MTTEFNGEAENQNRVGIKSNIKIMEDKKTQGAGFLFGALSFLVPLVGFILFFVWKSEKTRAAKQCGMWGLIGMLFSIIMIVVLYIFVFAAATSAYGGAYDDAMRKYQDAVDDYGDYGYGDYGGDAAGYDYNYGDAMDTYQDAMDAYGDYGYGDYGATMDAVEGMYDDLGYGDLYDDAMDAYGDYGYDASDYQDAYNDAMDMMNSYDYGSYGY